MTVRTPTLGTAPCECEHAAHFHDEVPRSLTPHGNPGHRYQTPFMVAQLVTVHTLFGPFTVCPDCAADCYAGRLARYLP
jgi:hypothetical protein